jgi:hypothetical protein
VAQQGRAFAEERNLVKNFEDKFKVRQILFPTYCMNIKRVNEKAGIKFKGMSK